MKIRIGIYGYGNLAKGVEKAVLKSGDMELVAIFTRRDPEKVVSAFGTKVISAEKVLDYKGKIDVLVNCGGSATDLPATSPVLARDFNIVDSFDTHANISGHFNNVDKASRAAGTIAVTSCGWDPGLFSMMRFLFGAVLPDSSTYCFWGTGISQGHSDAIRRINGVVDARQYTVPVEEAMERVRNGENPALSVREKHKRICFVVAEENADKTRIEKEIKEMPHYFDEYDTTVNFISKEELIKNHSGLPHAGFVIANGKTSEEVKQNMEFSLKLDSNPEFTGSVLTAVARAAHILSCEGEKGCRTMLDIPLKYLSPLTYEEILEHIL